jgi:hypothetical protein
MINTKSISALVIAGVLAASASMPAVAGNYYSDGQIAAGVLGAVLVGTAIANSNHNNYAPAQPYYAPQQSYYSQPQTTYYEAPQTYYAPAPVYYAPPVSYVAPRAVVYVNSGYGYGYNGYRNHSHQYYGYR